jgi:hypothetical protein
MCERYDVSATDYVRQEQHRSPERDRHECHAHRKPIFILLGLYKLATLTVWCPVESVLYRAWKRSSTLSFTVRSVLSESCPRATEHFTILVGFLHNQSFIARYMLTLNLDQLRNSPTN